MHRKTRSDGFPKHPVYSLVYIGIRKFGCLSIFDPSRTQFTFKVFFIKLFLITDCYLEGLKGMFLERERTIFTHFIDIFFS